MAKKSHGVQWNLTNTPFENTQECSTALYKPLRRSYPVLIPFCVCLLSCSSDLTPHVCTFKMDDRESRRWTFVSEQTNENRMAKDRLRMDNKTDWNSEEKRQSYGVRSSRHDEHKEGQRLSDT
uniref:Ovule protein n=1 Tax=Steinernema glaseri TaxID=37863 RepID=A0A1I8A685_9BILA